MDKFKLDPNKTTTKLPFFTLCPNFVTICDVCISSVFVLIPKQCLISYHIVWGRKSLRFKNISQIYNMLNVSYLIIYGGITYQRLFSNNYNIIQS